MRSNPYMIVSGSIFGLVALHAGGLEDLLVGWRQLHANEDRVSLATHPLSLNTRGGSWS